MILKKIKNNVLIISFIWIVFQSLILYGCADVSNDTKNDFNNEHNDTGFSYDSESRVKNQYLTNKISPCIPLSDFAPIWQIYTETGEMSVLCPDPACTHDKNTPTCIYNSINTVESVCEGNGYVLFMAYGVNKYSLYLFNRGSNTVIFLRSVDHANSYIVYGDGNFFFSELMSEDEATDENIVKIIKLDPVTEKETVIAHVTKDERVYDYCDGCIVTVYGFFQSLNRIYANEPYTKTKLLTPDGKEQFSIGECAYGIGNIAVRHKKPSAVYLYEKSDYLQLPVDCQITSVKRVDDIVVFQTVMSEPVQVKTGVDENGSDTFALIYIFDPVIYFVSEDGSYEAFEIETDYMFSICAVSDHKIYVSSDTVIEDGKPVIDQPEKFFLIDLDTGNAVMYDFELYEALGGGSVATENVTFKINKIH